MVELGSKALVIYHEDMKLWGGGCVKVLKGGIIRCASIPWMEVFKRLG